MKLPRALEESWAARSSLPLDRGVELQQLARHVSKHADPEPETPTSNEQTNIARPLISTTLQTCERLEDGGAF